MPPKNTEASNALTLLRRARTEPIMSMVKVGTGANFTSAVTRMVFRNIHLALISRSKETIELNATENSYAPEQRDGAEPVVSRVRVAVKPGMSKPKTNSMWDESVNPEANSKFKSLTSSKRSKQISFEWKEIPYDEWRKHYAKDKLGRYRGTEAPAEDTILIPEDEVKWRSTPSQARPHQSIEVEEASPGSESIERSTTLPEHEHEHEHVDPMLSPQPIQASAVETQQEEAIFVDETGHTASRVVQETQVGHT